MGQAASCPGCGVQNGFREIEKIDEFTILRCSACDLEFSHPMKTPGGEWYDLAYIVRHSVINTSIRDYYKWAVASLPIRGKLLDVGCGEGVFVNYARKNDFDAYGIDFSKDSIEAGKQLYALDTTYKCSLQEVQAKIRIAQFDVITSFEVLEHLEKPGDFLADVARLMKKDGYVAISVPYRDKWPLTEFNDYPPHHLTRWTERSLRTFFSLNNFEIVQSQFGSRFRSYRMFLSYLFRVVIYKILGMYRKGLTVKEPSIKKINFLKNRAVRLLLSRMNPRLIRDIIFWPIAAMTFLFVFHWFKGNNLMLIARKAEYGKALCPPPAPQKRTVIDRSLNYGRHHIEGFLSSAGAFRTVLDIGAGQGDDLMLAQKVNPEAAIHAVEVCSEYAARLVDKGITVYSLNIEKDRLPFPDGSVDVIIANQILEHVKELFWIFHEITRVLPIGGKVILGIPNLAALHNRILLAFGRQPSPLKNNSAHVRGYTKQDLMRFLESCFPGGYKLKAFGGSNFYPFPPVIAKPLATLFPTMAWGIFFLFEKQRSYHREFLEYPVTHRIETNFFLGAS